jgi:cytochrome P450
MSDVISATMPTFDRAPRPDHVPADHVIDFDYMNPDLSQGDVYAALKQLHAGKDILWSPRNGGHWIASRAEDVRWIQENFEIFSHEEFFVPRGTMRVVMPPLTVDPPLHARYRAVYNPFFTAARVQQMAVRARALTIELIEKIKPQGGCDFVEDFAHIMPVVMFLGIVDLPLDKREEFIEHGVGFVCAKDQAGRDRNLAPILAYLREVIDERYAHPGEDLFSKIAAWRDNPRFNGEDEIVGMALLIFLGGIDTVASLMSFVAWHLAEHPGHRRRLREEPDVIPRAAEEYIRRYGLSNTARLITRDVERKGVTMKKDEMVMVFLGASAIDERAYDNPFEVDFDRVVPAYHNEPGHNTFGHGPHKCVGRPLARVELKIFLEEWLRLIPEFRLDADHPPVSRMSNVNGVETLWLKWDV